MKINKVLYTNYGLINNLEPLKQALSFARKYNTKLGVLIICPRIPNNLLDLQHSGTQYIVGETNKQIKKICTELDYSDFKIHELKVEYTNIPHVSIIKEILNENYHLLIKQAEPTRNKNIKAIDMKLLRLAPCPIWLSKDNQTDTRQPNIAVAIDHSSFDTVELDLSVGLLQLSSALAQLYNSELQILSCLNTSLKSFLHKNMYLDKKQVTSIDDYINDKKNQTKTELEKIIEKSNISDNYSIYLSEGDPAEIIPDMVKTNKIDILILGSIAKVTIKGFYIGNNAEDIIQNSECSLITIKPKKFISPIS